MAKMTKNQLIDAIAEGTQVSKGGVKAVIEQMATVGYKELNESGEFVIPGFVKMSVVNKPATEARSVSIRHRPQVAYLSPSRWLSSVRSLRILMRSTRFSIPKSVKAITPSSPTP